jgi:hypothetical protein
MIKTALLATTAAFSTLGVAAAADSIPLTSISASAVAEAWVKDFNSHDIDAIMTHYAEDVELRSPVVVRLLGDTTGVVKGRAALKAYLAKGLAARPDLHFELLDVFSGVRDVSVYYRGVDDRLIVETMTLNDQGLVAQVVVTHQIRKDK